MRPFVGVAEAQEAKRTVSAGRVQASAQYLVHQGGLLCFISHLIHLFHRISSPWQGQHQASAQPNLEVFVQPDYSALERTPCNQVGHDADIRAFKSCQVRGHACQLYTIGKVYAASLARHGVFILAAEVLHEAQQLQTQAALRGFQGRAAGHLYRGEQRVLRRLPTTGWEAEWRQ